MIFRLKFENLAQDKKMKKLLVINALIKLIIIIIIIILYTFHREVEIELAKNIG